MRVSDRKIIDEYWFNKSQLNIFKAGVNYYRSNLFHKTIDELPQVYGEYEKDNYPQIPCLVKGNLSTGYGYGIRYWNVPEQCWDTEDCNDCECDKNCIEELAYLDDIIK